MPAVASKEQRPIYLTRKVDYCGRKEWWCLYALGRDGKWKRRLLSLMRRDAGTKRQRQEKMKEKLRKHLNEKLEPFRAEMRKIGTQKKTLGWYEWGLYHDLYGTAKKFKRAPEAAKLFSKYFQAFQDGTLKQVKGKRDIKPRTQPSRTMKAVKRTIQKQKSTRSGAPKAGKVVAQGPPGEHCLPHIFRQAPPEPEAAPSPKPKGRAKPKGAAGPREAPTQPSTAAPSTAGPPQAKAAPATSSQPPVVAESESTTRSNEPPAAKASPKEATRVPEPVEYVDMETGEVRVSVPAKGGLTPFLQRGGNRPQPPLCEAEAVASPAQPAAPVGGQPPPAAAPTNAAPTTAQPAKAAQRPNAAPKSASVQKSTAPPRSTAAPVGSQPAVARHPQPEAPERKEIPQPPPLKRKAEQSTTAAATHEVPPQPSAAAPSTAGPPQAKAAPETSFHPPESETTRSNEPPAVKASPQLATCLPEPVEYVDMETGEVRVSVPAKAGQAPLGRPLRATRPQPVLCEAEAVASTTQPAAVPVGGRPPPAVAPRNAAPAAAQPAKAAVASQPPPAAPAAAQPAKAAPAKAAPKPAVPKPTAHHETAPMPVGTDPQAPPLKRKAAVEQSTSAAATQEALGSAAATAPTAKPPVKACGAEQSKRRFKSSGGNRALLRMAQQAVQLGEQAAEVAQKAVQLGEQSVQTGQQAAATAQQAAATAQQAAAVAQQAVAAAEQTQMLQAMLHQGRQDLEARVAALEKQRQGKQQ